MKILLTGALGFIGKNFLLYRNPKWQIFALDLIEDKNFQKKIKNTKFFKINLSDENQVKKLSKKMPQFDACLFLCANGDPALSVPDPLWDIRSTTETLINACQHFKIKKLIYLSSGAVYNGNRGLISPKTVINPSLPYAISHYSAELYARFFKETGRLGDYVVIRFFGAYGPYEPPRKIYTNFVKELAAKKKNEFNIRGNGKNLIDAMFVLDAVKGFSKVIESQRANLTVDFCKGDHPSVNELTKEAAGVFNHKIKITHNGQVPEYNQFYASPKEFEKLFGFRPKISLAEGLKKLREYLENRV